MSDAVKNSPKAGNDKSNGSTHLQCSVYVYGYAKKKRPHQKSNTESEKRRFGRDTTYEYYRLAHDSAVNTVRWKVVWVPFRCEGGRGGIGATVTPKSRKRCVQNTKVSKVKGNSGNIGWREKTSHHRHTYSRLPLRSVPSIERSIRPTISARSHPAVSES